MISCLWYYSDSDILVIILTNFKYLKDKIQIIINLSTSKIIYLNINESYAKLGVQILSYSLAICHIFTGNDYNPVFFYKEKKETVQYFEEKIKKIKEGFIQLLRSEHTAALITLNEVVRIITAIFFFV